MSQVLFESIGAIAVLTLNAPERRNALSTTMLRALQQCLERASEPDVRAVVVRAVGTAFCSGHDLRELTGSSREAQESLFTLCTAVMEAIRNLPKPVIAEVQGIATAAGCQLVATCDLVVASDRATFATPGVKIGLFCTTPAVPLIRTIATKHAMDLLLTGREISAHEAHDYGLVNRVVPAERLPAETMALARQVAATPPETIALGKRALYQQAALDWAAAYAVAQRAIVENAQFPVAQEGIRAFLEKRLPNW